MYNGSYTVGWARYIKFRNVPMLVVVYLATNKYIYGTIYQIDELVVCCHCTMNLTFILNCIILQSILVASIAFTYSELDDWAGICNNVETMRQSPINIITSVSPVNDAFIDLKLFNWDLMWNGDFMNTDNTVAFTLKTAGLIGPWIHTHLGSYYVHQIHMHWGNIAGQGSEHKVNGKPAELEIHIVHAKLGESNISASDHVAVIGVLADVDMEAPIEGVWTQLDPTRIQSFNSHIPVLDLKIHQLLPKKTLDYWHYEGSLTTPPCSENVAWFILQNRITVPGIYLDMLRLVQTADGSTLGANFRMEQDISNRSVNRYPGQIVATVTDTTVIATSTSMSTSGISKRLSQAITLTMLHTYIVLLTI